MAKLYEERDPNRSYTEREWRKLARVGSSGSTMVKPTACIHGVRFGKHCRDCDAWAKENEDV